MRSVLVGVICLCTGAAALLAQSGGNPFVGRWDFDSKSSGDVGANWLGITEKKGTLEIWFQPTGGHVYQVKDFHVDGSHLTMTVAPASDNHPAMTWELTATKDKLTGTQKQGDHTTEL